MAKSKEKRAKVTLECTGCVKNSLKEEILPRNQMDRCKSIFSLKLKPMGVFLLTKGIRCAIISYLPEGDFGKMLHYIFIFNNPEKGGE